MTLLLSSLWQKFKPFLSIWRYCTSRRALQQCHISHIQKIRRNFSNSAEPPCTRLTLENTTTEVAGCVGVGGGRAHEAITVILRQPFITDHLTIRLNGVRGSWERMRLRKLQHRGSSIFNTFYSYTEIFNLPYVQIQTFIFFRNTFSKKIDIFIYHEILKELFLIHGRILTYIPAVEKLFFFNIILHLLIL